MSDDPSIKVVREQAESIGIAISDRHAQRIHQIAMIKVMNDYTFFVRDQLYEDRDIGVDLNME